MHVTMTKPFNMPVLTIVQLNNQSDKTPVYASNNDKTV